MNATQYMKAYQEWESKKPIGDRLTVNGLYLFDKTTVKVDFELCDKNKVKASIFSERYENFTKKYDNFAEKYKNYERIVTVEAARRCLEHYSMDNWIFDYVQFDARTKVLIREFLS